MKTIRKIKIVEYNSIHWEELDETGWKTECTYWVGDVRFAMMSKKEEVKNVAA